jgi:hypothetical protein
LASEESDNDNVGPPKKLLPDRETRSMPEYLDVNENWPPQIRKALAECRNGAQVAQSKANLYLKLSQGETVDSAFEACRSMHRFYSSMSAFFLEGVNRKRGKFSGDQAVAAFLTRSGRGGIASPSGIPRRSPR